MSTDSPQLPPQEIASADNSLQRTSKRVATALFSLGLLILAYGAMAFWFIKSLPPNEHNRLPSLYVMGVGIAVTLVGLIARDLRVGKKNRERSPSTRQGISTIYGILILVAIIAAFFVVVSQM